MYKSLIILALFVISGCVGNYGMGFTDTSPIKTFY